MSEGEIQSEGEGEGEGEVQSESEGEGEGEIQSESGGEGSMDTAFERSSSVLEECRGRNGEVPTGPLPSQPPGPCAPALARQACGALAAGGPCSSGAASGGAVGKRSSSGSSSSMFPSSLRAVFAAHADGSTTHWQHWLRLAAALAEFLVFWWVGGYGGWAPCVFLMPGRLCQMVAVVVVAA